MYREIEEALAKKLSNIKIQDENKSLVTVPIVVGNFEEWLKTKSYPSINVHRLPKGTLLDSSRGMSSLEIIELDDKFYEVPSRIPYNLIYEIEFLCRWQQDFVFLAEKILRRFRPYGFNAYLNVNGEAVQYKVADIQDLSSLEKKDTRDFRWSMTLTVETWLDPYDPDEDGALVEIPRIEKINVGIENRQEELK